MRCRFESGLGHGTAFANKPNVDDVRKQLVIRDDRVYRLRGLDEKAAVGDIYLGRKTTDAGGEAVIGNAGKTVEYILTQLGDRTFWAVLEPLSPADGASALIRFLQEQKP